MRGRPSCSSRMRVINHNWSATKQRPHPQSVAEISRHSVLSGDRIRQCKTSSGSRHKDSSVKDAASALSTLEACLASLYSWFCHNGLALNASKSEPIIFGTHQRLNSFLDHLSSIFSVRHCPSLIASSPSAPHWTQTSL